MSTAALDEIQSWALGRLKQIGYACGKVTVVGDPHTGIAEVEIDSGTLKTFPTPHLAQTPDLSAGAISRYDAFREGDPFDWRMLSLSASRITSKGIVVSATYPYNCDSDGSLTLSRKLIEGEPRMIQLGVGGTSEEAPIARAIWRHVRIGSEASTLGARLYVSPIHQLLELSLNAYFFENSPRTSFDPKLKFERWNEQDLKGYEVSAPLQVGHTWEKKNSSLQLEVGPTLSYQRFTEALHANARFQPFYDGQLIWTSHEAEFYAQDPRSGDQASLAWSMLSKSLGSSTDAGKFDFNYSQLWNLAELEPPSWVLGARIGFSTIATRGGDGTDAELPPTFNDVMGGDQDLRGYGRRELPGAGQLALTDFYSSLELRKSNWLPAHVDPFVFFDLGWLGHRTLALDATVYTSPGFGVRWLSPIGSVRGSLAHGWIVGREPLQGRTAAEHFQFFISLGKEF